MTPRLACLHWQARDLQAAGKRKTDTIYHPAGKFMILSAAVRADLECTLASSMKNDLSIRSNKGTGALLATG